MRSKTGTPVPPEWTDWGAVMVLQTKYDVLLPENDQQRHYFSELSNVHHTQSQNKLFFGLSVLVTHSAHSSLYCFFVCFVFNYGSIWIHFISKDSNKFWIRMVLVSIGTYQQRVEKKVTFHLLNYLKGGLYQASCCCVFNYIFTNLNYLLQAHQ